MEILVRTPLQLANTIRVRRRELGLSQEQLAAKAGVRFCQVPVPVHVVLICADSNLRGPGNPLDYRQIVRRGRAAIPANEIVLPDTAAFFEDES
jgi:transcriptional regulator with XRE-family HTH domain